LQNHRHHAGLRQTSALNPLSSALYFDGFLHGRPGRIGRDSPITQASTWLLRIGWRRHGLLRRDEVPRDAGVRDGGPGARTLPVCKVEHRGTSPSLPARRA
jgi:hypothetical protein